jgi:hypothetical protein
MFLPQMAQIYTDFFCDILCYLWQIYFKKKILIPNI